MRQPYRPTIYLILSLFLPLYFFSAANGQLVSASTVQKGIMPVYIGNSEAITHLKPNDLERLRKAGINHLIVGGWTAKEFNDVINAFNNNSVLNKFRLILNIGSPVNDAYVGCMVNGNCNVNTLPANLPLWLTSFLDSVILLAKNNSVVGGYYTFDEPATPKTFSGITYTISKEYQIAIYNYIRNQDNAINSRPVCLANMMYHNNPTYALPDSIIDYSMSNDAQDLFFIDQYDPNVNLQEIWFAKWRDKGLTAKPYVIILPSIKTNGQSCGSSDLANCANSILQAITTVFQNNPPVIKGVGAFAYWPVNKTDFSQSLDNCATLMEELCNYLSNLPTGLMAEWRLDGNTNNSGPLGTNATVIGTPENSSQYYVEGKGSLFFDGAGEGLQLAPGNGFLKNAFTSRTVLFWMRPFSPNATQLLYEEGDSGNGLAARIYQGGLQVAMANLGSGQIFTVPGFIFSERKWYHISIVYDNGNLKVYIDGQLKLHTTTHTIIGAHWDAAGLGIASTDAGIGNAFGANDATQSFHGFLDDVQIYEPALSAEKVYYIGQGLFGHWRWNGTTANEGSGNTAATLLGDYADPYEGDFSIGNDTDPWSVLRGARLSDPGDFMTAEVTQRTIMFWMKPTQGNSTQLLFEEGDSGNGIAIRLNTDNKLEVAVACFGVNQLTLSSYNVSINNWHYVAVVFDYGEVKIYIDNHTATNTFVYPGLNPTSGAAGLGIDAIAGGTGNAFGANDDTPGFIGLIDDCRIYNSVMPEEYIRDMCANCGPITSPRLATQSVNTHSPRDAAKKDYLHIYSTGAELIIQSSAVLKSYKLIDISGRTLVNKTSIHAHTARVNIQNFPEGVYIVQTINEKGKTIIRKIVR